MKFKEEKLIKLSEDIKEGNDILKNFNRDKAINYIKKQLIKNIELNIFNKPPFIEYEKVADKLLKVRIKEIIEIIEILEVKYIDEVKN